MSDQALAVQAIAEAQRILEEYLEPRHHDNERLLDRLVEVLERPSVLVAVDRLPDASFGDVQHVNSSIRAAAGSPGAATKPVDDSV